MELITLGLIIVIGCLVIEYEKEIEEKFDKWMEES